MGGFFRRVFLGVGERCAAPGSSAHSVKHVQICCNYLFVSEEWRSLRYLWFCAATDIYITLNLDSDKRGGISTQYGVVALLASHVTARDGRLPLDVGCEGQGLMWYDMSCCGCVRPGIFSYIHVSRKYATHVFGVSACLCGWQRLCASPPPNTDGKRGRGDDKRGRGAQPITISLFMVDCYLH